MTYWWCGEKSNKFTAGGNHEYKETVSLNCVQSSLNPVYRILPWQWFFSFHHLLHCTSSSSSRIYTNLLRCSFFNSWSKPVCSHLSVSRFSRILIQVLPGSESRISWVWSRFSWIWIRTFLDLNSIYLNLNLGPPGSESRFSWIWILVFVDPNPGFPGTEPRFF